ncbi:MAG: NAD(+)/NADH kinase [Actinomycetota bacterium]|nr:NAD(+)/NADH kinase [Actinomycetota bacterium]
MTETPASSGGRAARTVRTAAVYTHRRSGVTTSALRELITLARERGVGLRLDPAETAKHGLEPGAGLILDARPDPTVDVCIALGGDGTILSAVRTYARSGVPVFGINFGEMGFLATVDREQAGEGYRRALDGDFEVLSLPAIEVAGPERPWVAINDVSIHRQPGNRVADLEYTVGGEEVGRVRCDGLVVSTPAGSTGYNLANGGPVMAWGVHGFLVSFIAPHSLTARTLVVAPDDQLVIHNRSQEEAVDVTVDGRPICLLKVGDRLQCRFADGLGCLAQLPGTTFYQRLRLKFGRLS